MDPSWLPRSIFFLHPSPHAMRLSFNTFFPFVKAHVQPDKKLRHIILGPANYPTSQNFYSSISPTHSSSDNELASILANLSESPIQLEQRNGSSNSILSSSIQSASLKSLEESLSSTNPADTRTTPSPKTTAPTSLRMSLKQQFLQKQANESFKVNDYTYWIRRNATLGFLNEAVDILVEMKNAGHKITARQYEIIFREFSIRFGPGFAFNIFVLGKTDSRNDLTEIVKVVRHLVKFMRDENIMLSDQFYKFLLEREGKFEHAEKIYEILVSRNVPPSIHGIRNIFRLMIEENKSLQEVKGFKTAVSFDTEKEYSIAKFYYEYLVKFGHYDELFNELTDMANQKKLSSFLFLSIIRSFQENFDITMVNRLIQFSKGLTAENFAENALIEFQSEKFTVYPVSQVPIIVPILLHLLAFCIDQKRDSFAKQLFNQLGAIIDSNGTVKNLHEQDFLALQIVHYCSISPEKLPELGNKLHAIDKPRSASVFSMILALLHCQLPRAYFSRLNSRISVSIKALLRNIIVKDPIIAIKFREACEHPNFMMPQITDMIAGEGKEKSSEEDAPVHGEADSDLSYEQEVLEDSEPITSDQHWKQMSKKLVSVLSKYSDKLDVLHRTLFLPYFQSGYLVGVQQTMCFLDALASNGNHDALRSCLHDLINLDSQKSFPHYLDPLHSFTKPLIADWVLSTACNGADSVERLQFLSSIAKKFYKKSRQISEQVHTKIISCLKDFPEMARELAFWSAVPQSKIYFTGRRFAEAVKNNQASAATRPTSLKPQLKNVAPLKNSSYHPMSMADSEEVKFPSD
jgi:hypothetical protein